ncbi:hypothetical protein AJ85_04185 [Alkalihalobacillus alcalophilus ATCC 27647 = CGMCC 1.3604]|uniref:Uncharacterized protein n=1 Tax=Alkalihalobacillus alcalophilus ATCC 27647 = CGMCC 1.3604 TaxID=1218173 RepID=A0A094XHV1_ALKAL|nr:hypothetical protein [Alkalihalobacillus alcalophilus]KGA98355.1 hypothetical protein BALCAV_0204540 [Alkalihalobacillus alcalophilus ATCC 27647 = CGMCC 1.3604]MED1563655.1 hypothetical protein [Alkalihalobacillus alcalophilus]THG91635.1 hypothetical protein AJ85_04185 [Alkalihalobacillus alcalophilus ATCC 27647 = CGMCC 1.3604]
MFKSKNVLFILFVLLIASAGAFFYMANRPPLIATPSLPIHLDGKQVQIVSVGNQSRIGNIRFVEVLINDNEIPLGVKIQQSNVKRGFLTNDVLVDSDEGHVFIPIAEAQIPRNTNPKKQLEEMYTGQVEESEVDTYAIHIVHNDNIREVVIKYRHFASELEKRIRFF